MHVKVEQGPRLSAGFVDYEVVECIVLEGADEIDEGDKWSSVWDLRGV